MSKVQLETPDGSTPPDGFTEDRDRNDPPPIVLHDGPAIAKPLPDLEYLVREIGLVAGGGAPHLFAGYGFSGKTLSLQSLALSLAAGRVAWGAYACKPRRVVHVDLEQGERLTFRRYQRLAHAMGLDLPGLCDDLVVAVFPPLSLTLELAYRWREIMTGRDVLILDSLRAATGGQDENSSEIRAGLDMLGFLSNETGCRVIVIHHSRKPTKDEAGGRYAIRGSSAIFDACDATYTFSAEKGEAVKVENSKARSHGELVEDFALVIADTDDRAGLSVRLHGAELVTQQREAKAKSAKRAICERDVAAITAFLARRTGPGRRELSEALGLSNNRVGSALAHLGDAIEVRAEKDGRVTRNRHFLRGTP
jgi:hypothetical protein